MDQQIIRQGDVLVVPCDSIPAKAQPGARDAGRVVLAWGEVTGHRHQIADRGATLLSVSENERFLRIVGSGATLQHEEHGAIAIAPGTYRVVRQREWTDEDEPIYVAD
jgi:hypothetical protein